MAKSLIKTSISGALLSAELAKALHIYTNDAPRILQTPSASATVDEAIRGGKKLHEIPMHAPQTDGSSLMQQGFSVREIEKLLNDAKIYASTRDIRDFQKHGGEELTREDKVVREFRKFVDTRKRNEHDSAAENRRKNTGSLQVSVDHSPTSTAEGL